MESKTVTTPDVGAQESCVLSSPAGFDGIGRIEDQPGFSPITRRALMATVNTVARDLGLRPASVVVLDALLSCLPCKHPQTGQETAITPLTLLTVFAANDTLCFRAKGITDRQLRRHLERLEETGLIRRRDSANGKRFPVHRKGRIVGAFGIDLSPLLARSEDLQIMADTRRQEVEELRGLKACIQTLRAECLKLDLPAPLIAYVESTRNLMRRVGTTVLQARAVIAKLTEVFAAAPARPEPDSAPAAVPDPDQMTASDGQNVRHKEPEKPDTKNPGSRTFVDLWSKLTAIPDFYPEAPDTPTVLHRMILEFAGLLGIGRDTILSSLQRLGPLETLWQQDRIARRVAEIANPDGYLAGIIQRHSSKVGHGQPASWPQ